MRAAPQLGVVPAGRRDARLKATNRFQFVGSLAVMDAHGSVVRVCAMPAVLIAGLAAIAAITLTVMAYGRGTGLPADPGDGTADNPPRPAKTLWDWLQLLIVPLVLALAAFALNAAQSDRDRKQEERRAEQERALEERRAVRERALADDRAREDTLRTYLQQMSDLITRGALQARQSRDRPENTLARTLTLVALRRLDGTRKGLVVQFLKEADLINSTAVYDRTKQGWNYYRAPSSVRPRVSLAGADLRGAVMPWALLSWADSAGPGGRERANAAVLDRADLRNADFRGGYLYGVSLMNADLRGADFSGAELDGTSFNGACLSGARFTRAKSYAAPIDFRSAEGRGVDFSGADLKNASFRWSRLYAVKLAGASTSGVVWPRGWTSTGLPMRDAHSSSLCRAVLR
jgi:uncharacterized protein YjbI with pentapeptide repeats